MSIETPSIPIYISLHESKFKGVERTVESVETLKQKFSLEDDIMLEKVTTSQKGLNLYVITYCIQTKPQRQRHSDKVGGFLDSVFSQLAEKHPVFSEPPQ